MERLILLLLKEHFLGAAELLEVFLRQIDAALGRIGPDVPQNVRQLERHPETDGVVLRPGRCRPEDVEADQSYDRRDAIAIEREVLHRSVSHRREIHAHALDQLFEIGSRDGELSHMLRQADGHREGRRPFIGGLKLIPPPLQFLGGIAARRGSSTALSTSLQNA